MIRTERLILRAPALTDRDALHAVYGDPTVMKHWSSAAHETVAQTAELLDQLIRGERDLGPECIIERDGCVIGRIGIWEKWEIGYLLHSDHWGQGLASEALAAFLPAAFQRHPDMNVITADIDPLNVGSGRVLEKAGFKVTGHAKNTFCINDVWADSTYFALKREECPGLGVLS